MNHAWQFLRRAGHGIGRGLSISLIEGWRLTRWVGLGIGHGLLLSLIKIWQLTSWAGRKIGRGLSISLTKTWQFTCWVVPKIGKGIWFSLTKTWQFIYWVVPRICRGLWFLLSTTWMVFWWIVRELLILLIKMVNGPKRALTVLVTLVVLLHLWEHQWGGVRYPTLVFLTENPTFTYLRIAGILAGLVNLFLFYKWFKSRWSPKANLPASVDPRQANLPASVDPQQDRHFEQPMAILRLPSRRVYSDIEKARAIVAMSQSGSVPYVSQQLDIPPSTLHNWKNKYQMDSRFQWRIDQVIWLVTLGRTNLSDRQDQIETKHRYLELD